jgi:nicotinate-nucleotide pyrophosphorylase (carboxylating)
MRPEAPGVRIHPQIRQAIRGALREDIGDGDKTTDRIVPARARMQGAIVAKQDGVVAGLEVARAVYGEVEPSVQFRSMTHDGERVRRGETLAEVSGPARALLTAERTALNFLGRMSGIATLTRQFVEAVEGTGAVILDTRKTAPGLRLADKLAVKLGGGGNHRAGLFDMILIKDNHIDFAGGVQEAVRKARMGKPEMEIEVEARTLDELREALDLDVGRILLDNMQVAMLAEAVRINGGRATLEASGNVTLENVRRIAETGVDYISSGALTHSAKNFDLSFEYVKKTGAARRRQGES